MALLYRYGWWDVDEITKIKSVDITLSTYEIVWIDDDTRTLFRFCVAYEWARVKNPKLFTENAHVQTRVIPTITATVVSENVRYCVTTPWYTRNRFGR